jgi:DNA-binding transcriptional ArsR family regulator
MQGCHGAEASCARQPPTRRGTFAPWAFFRRCRRSCPSTRYSSASPQLRPPLLRARTRSITLGREGEGAAPLCVGPHIPWSALPHRLERRERRACAAVKTPMGKVGLVIGARYGTIRANMQTEYEDMTMDHVALAAGLGALGDPTRLRLLALLMTFTEPLCVCELSSGLDLPEYQTSRHLTALKRAGLVACEKQGLWTYYRVTDNSRFRFLRNAVRADPQDLVRMLSRLRQRVSGLCVVGPAKAPRDERRGASPRAGTRQSGKLTEGRGVRGETKARQGSSRAGLISPTQSTAGKGD